MRTKKILNAVEEVDRKVTVEIELFKKFNDITGSMLIDKVNENDKNLEKIIELKDRVNVQEKLIESQEKDIASNKETIKNLTSEINKLVKYKNENETLKKENESSKKENKDLKAKLKKLEDKGVVLPTKVKGSTMPKKKQAVKETVRPVKN